MPGEYLLVIDDSPTVRKVVERALSEAGHRVLAAADGEAALALIRETRAVPELILLDGLIPGRDAADFCRQLTDKPSLARVPVVVMIARGQADGCFRTGLDPVDVHMMIAALGMFNVTNQHTFAAIFQRDMGAKGNVGRRRELVTEVILRFLEKT